MPSRSPVKLPSVLLPVAWALAVAACGQSGGADAAGTGGMLQTGGSGTGGVTMQGGASGSGGQNPGSGGQSAGGAGGSRATGGSTSGTGGAATGGTSETSTGGRTAGTGGSSGGGGTTATGGTGARDGAADGPYDGGSEGGGDSALDGGSDATSDGKGGTGGTGSGGAGTGTGGRGTGGAGTGGAGTGGSTGLSDVKVWLAGDSTVANGSTPCPVGWGKQFQALFGTHVTVNNSAQGGRSVQTWLYDVSTTMGSDGECVLNSTNYLTAWTTMLDGMKTGDYLFIQFGINDGDSSCNRHVGTALFQKYYGMMAQAAKDRGAHPIFVTPVSSISCSGSKAVATRGAYATATKQAGTTYSVPVIDLESLSVALYTSLGFCPLPGPDTATTFESGAIGNFFCEDHTHFEAAGATQIAGLIAKALRDQGIGLSSYLK